MTQLLIPGSLAPRLPPALREAYERAAHHVREIHAPNTKRAYTAAWTAWSNHCSEHGLEPLPVDPLHLIGYLSGLTHLAPNSVRLQLAALASLDEGHAVSVGDLERPKLRHNVLVRRWHKGWAREHPIAPKKRAAALTPSELVRVLQVAQEPGRNASRIAHAARYARDKAILVLGVNGAFRVSELAALNLADVIDTPDGLRVVVRRTKNDQHGKSRIKGLLAQRNLAVCPIEAFRQWVRFRGDAPGPLFVGISRSGLLEQKRLSLVQCMRLIKDRCHAAGLTHVTSHSLRATFGTLAKKKPLSEVMEHGGWETAAIALRYQRQGSLFDDSPTRGLLDE